jgi:hypothetical protein
MQSQKKTIQAMFLFKNNKDQGLWIANRGKNLGIKLSGIVSTSTQLWVVRFRNVTLRVFSAKYCPHRQGRFPAKSSDV